MSPCLCCIEKSLQAGNTTRAKPHQTHGGCRGGRTGWGLPRALLMYIPLSTASPGLLHDLLAGLRSLSTPLSSPACWTDSQEPPSKGCLSPTASRVGPTCPLSQPLLHALACPSCCSSRLPCRPIQRPLHTALLSTLRSQPKQLQLMGRRRWLCPGWALFPEPASHSSLRQEGLLSPPFPRWGTKAGAVRNHLGVT